jgi:phospholipid/cholesterol/gamma-HCH transport system substrate-binding protein
MTIARAAAIGALVVAIIAVGVLMFGGGGGTEYTVHLQTANQLVKGNEVRVGGLAVGEITDIKLSEDNQADIKIEVKDDFAPLRRGSSMTVRWESLPSVANRYLALHPGPNNAPEIPEGGIVDTDQTTNMVDLDQLFNTLDPKARKGLQGVLRGFGTWYVGQSENLQQTFEYLAPSLGNLSRVMEELARDQKAFESFIVNGAKAVSAIAERRDDLAELVTNGTGFARALGQENVALDRTLASLPDVLQQGTVTFRTLQSALDDLDRLTDVSKPQVKGLAPFLRRFAGLFATCVPPSTTSGAS